MPAMFRRSHIFATIFFASLFSQAATLRADDGNLFPATAPAASMPISVIPSPDFGQGTWTFSLYGGYDQEFSSDPKLGYGSVGIGYYPFDFFSVNAEARVYGSSQEGPDTPVFDLDLLIRQHFLRGDRWTLFVDASAGVSLADHHIPEDGTNFNFIEECGIGATYKLDDHMHLMAGVRYFHLSNARLHGSDENPALNGLGVYFGLLFTF